MLQQSRKELAGISEKETEDLNWISSLQGAEEGKPGFVCGNGVSGEFYDFSKLKNYGPLVGCNLLFKKVPLDYLVWQDTSVTSQCVEFNGIKITNYRRRKTPHIANTGGVFFHHYGKIKKKPNALQAGHSGMLALQVAVILGCNPVFMVGCDCSVFRDRNRGTSKWNGWRSNRFRDKTVERQVRGKQPFDTFRGKQTTRLLISFAKKFDAVIRELNDLAEFYQMGDWGIVDIPSVEFPELWTPEHPKYGKRT